MTKSNKNYTVCFGGELCTLRPQIGNACLAAAIYEMQ